MNDYYVTKTSTILNLNDGIASMPLWSIFDYDTTELYITCFH